MTTRTSADVLNLLAARKGHFPLESGHQGELWLDFELLCIHPKRIQPLCSELAECLRQVNVEVVCGPLIEGAFESLAVSAAHHSRR
jgi:orotate phosphoribosyltransferase